MIKCVEDFVRAAQKGADIYEMFESDTDEDTRDAIYNFADPESPEPFRSACYNMGMFYGVRALRDY